MSLPTRNGTYRATGSNNHEYTHACLKCESYNISIFKSVPRCAVCKRDFTTGEIERISDYTWKSLNNFKFKGNRYTRTNTPLKPMPATIRLKSALREEPMNRTRQDVAVIARHKHRTLSSIEQETEALRRRLQELQEEKHMIAADSPYLFTSRLFRAIQSVAVFFRSHAGSELLKKHKVTPSDLSAMEHIMRMPIPPLEKEASKLKGITTQEWIKREEQRIAKRQAKVAFYKKNS